MNELVLDGGGTEKIWALSSDLCEPGKWINVNISCDSHRPQSHFNQKHLDTSSLTSVKSALGEFSHRIHLSKFVESWWTLIILWFEIIFLITTRLVCCQHDQPIYPWNDWVNLLSLKSIVFQVHSPQSLLETGMVRNQVQKHQDISSHYIDGHLITPLNVSSSAD